MPKASLGAWSGTAVRIVVVLCALALLFTTFAASASPVVGADLTHRVSSARSSQLYYESAMRTQDRTLSRIGRQRKKAKRSLRRAVRTLKRAKRPYARASRILRVRARRLKDAEARFPDAADAPDPANWKAKMIRLRRELRQAQVRRRSVGKKIRITSRNRNARRRQVRALKRARRVAISRRDSAAGALAARIVQMTSLAQQRSSRWTDVRLSDGPSAFEWPAKGTITQPFGCTGFRLNPRRGSCRHFHDGIDLASGYGSAVRAAAVGTVAYVGWNPWDRGSRAFIVVIGHPGGYVTRYAHVIASRRVRVGQLVRKGQIIARMGSTGESTGTHLHMELLKGTTPLNPVSYLPSGVVKVRSHSERKKGKSAKRKSSRRKKSAARQKGKTKPSTDRRDATLDGSASPEGSDPAAPGVAASCTTGAATLKQANAATEENAVLDYLTAKAMALSRADEDGCLTEQTSPGLWPTTETPPGVSLRTARASSGGQAASGERSIRLPRRGTSPLPQ